MADQEHSRGTTGPVPDADAQESSSMAPPTRHDTTSTISSDDYNQLPPGRYKLPINGNCPLCHHHHNAVLIKVKVSPDLNPVSRVHCENCQNYWLAIGRGNSSRFSLLSQCTEPDQKEIAMRKETRKKLIDMVRSVTSVASLSNIPESASQQPSREPSIRNPTSQLDAEDPTNVDNAKPHPSEETLPGSKLGPYEIEPAHDSRPTTRVDLNLNADDRRTKKVLTRLKRKLQDHLPQWKPSHLRKFLRLSKAPPMTERRRGKLPATPSPVIPQESYGDKDIVMSNEHPAETRDEEAGPSDMKEYEARKHPRETPSDSNPDMDREELKKMNRDELIAWLRKQFTTRRRCRCNGDCHCRRTSEILPDGRVGFSGVQSLSIRPPSVPSQRHSELRDLMLRDEHFHPSDIIEYPRSLSIGSTTIVATDTLTATSGGPARLSAHIFDAHRDRHRSRSPRPDSFHMRSRFRQHWPDSADGRSSGESFGTGGAVRSLSGFSRRGTDGLSASPAAPTSMPVGYETNPAEPQGYLEILPNAGTSSTPYLNGYRTSSERGRDSLPPA